MAKCFQNLRDAARGQDCMIRVPGGCNFNPETTVLCHLRMAGITGGGQKSPDFLGAWGCSDCHRIVDSHGGTVFDRDVVQLLFLQGMARTQYQLITRGIVKL